MNFKFNKTKRKRKREKGKKIKKQNEKESESVGKYIHNREIERKLEQGLESKNVCHQMDRGRKCASKN